MKKNVIVIGSGAREHAISWKLLESNQVDKVILIPGNGFNHGNDRVVNHGDCKIDDHLKIQEIALKYAVELVVVGPEVPLVDGLCDRLKRVGIQCFGPQQRAAVIEGSKCWCKDFMQRHSIPTARYKLFTDYESAKRHVEKEIDYRIVIKASGCAAGKGVIIPTTLSESLDALKRIMVDREFGDAGNELVIEEYLEGEEVSVMCFSDGYSMVVLPPAQDHKRIFNDDKGPNTGGMGAYAPTPFVCDTNTYSKTGFGPFIDEIADRVLKPTIDGMRKEGRPFVGVLFAGMMIGKNREINVLEFNCRLGDPETQVTLPLLDGDLYEIMLACTESRLDSVQVKWRKEYAVTVVMASQGYPDSYPKGKVITGVEGFKNNATDKSILFQAGTVYDQSKQQLLTNGGRVLSLTSLDSTLEGAITQCYQQLKGIQFEGCQFRTDIGRKGLTYQQLQKEKLNNKNSSVTYSESGVDIERGDKVVDNIAPMAKSTNRSGCMSDLGGFGALFDPKAAGFKDPILVSGTDGVGTKLKIAQEINRHEDIGIDLVAMCVNDVLVQGAEPLYFLDYFATGKIHVDVATKVINGISRGCKQSGCALIGGETAEMPGMYRDGEYDLAGFSVGAVERESMLPKNIKEGDVLLGLSSSGVHSNGYSLVRYLVEKKSGLVNNEGGSVYHCKAPFDQSKTLGEVLLTPTKLYVLSCLDAIKNGSVNGLAHITGGGITENLPRVIPDGLDCHVKLGSWPILPIFKWLQEVGKIEQLELLRTFNCGIGMVVIVDRENVSKVTKILEKHNEQVYEIGEIKKSTTITKTTSKVVYY